MAQSDAERARNYRWSRQLEKAIDKVYSLLNNMPQKYRDDPRNLPIEPDLDLLDCLEKFLGAEPEYIEDGGQDYVRLKLPNYANLGPLSDSEDPVADYEEHIEAKEIELAKTYGPERVRTTRTAFCRDVLRAEMTNDRWSWVATSEIPADAPGCLYLFAWEHNRQESDGAEIVRLFHKDVSLDARGRRRLGHKEALEKVDLALHGKYVPYVVWQKAADPNHSPKKIDYINGSFVSGVELYIDDTGTWCGKISEERAIA